MKKSFSILIAVSILAVMGMFQGCKKATVPELTTVAVTEVTLNSAVSGGNIVGDGGEDITAKGVCWSTSVNPTIADTKTTDGTGSASFTSNLVGLSEGTTYYVRAYATNEVGTAYGDELTFTTDEVTGAVLTTTEVSAVTSSSAVAGGNITDDGGGNIIARGVCWGIAPNPTVAGNKTTNGTGEGDFTSNLTNLSDGTVYYYRAYATNSSGTNYGQEYQFITPVTDIDGNIYKTVKIGNQVWMEENLKTTKYNDDSAIPNVINNTEWSTLKTGAYCWANNDEATYKPLYGALYNWYAVETDKLCPTGWRVPTDNDFMVMEMALGMTQVQAEGTEWRGTDQGSKLKSITGWLLEGNGTNTSGFNALPAGYRFYGDGTTKGLGLITYFWSANYLDDLLATYRRLDSEETEVYRNATHKEAGKSIRCVKNQ
ncbi:MAG: FISUMP domain-containing protein [Bacteroidales bacterium]